MAKNTLKLDGKNLISRGPSHLVININISLLYSYTVVHIRRNAKKLKKHKALLLFLSLVAFRLGGGGLFAPP